MTAPVTKGVSIMTKTIPDILEDEILPFDWDVRKVWELKADVVDVPTFEFVYLLKLPLWSSVPKYLPCIYMSPAKDRFRICLLCDFDWSESDLSDT